MNSAKKEAVRLTGMGQTTDCPRFTPRSIFDPDRCRYWDDGTPRWPAHCKHPACIICDTRGFRIMPRPDSDDDGDPE